MKKENKYCTNEQSKKLHELGITGTEIRTIIEGYYPLPDVAELGVMIGNDSGFNIYVHDGSAGIYSKSTGSCVAVVHSVHEAHIRAAILIYLLENKFITAEEANKRLNNN